jgi:hypothetical protein
MDVARACVRRDTVSAAVRTVVVLVTHAFLQVALRAGAVAVAVQRRVAKCLARRREEVVVALADPGRRAVAVTSTRRLCVAVLAAMVTKVVSVTPARAIASALTMPTARHLRVAVGAAVGSIEVWRAAIARCAMVVPMAHTNAADAARSMLTACRGVIAVDITVRAVKVGVTGLATPAPVPIVAQTRPDAAAFAVSGAGSIRSTVGGTIRSKVV